MSTVRTALGALTATSALVVITAGMTITPAIAQTSPPSVVQLCAATSVKEVDALLNSAAQTDLVDALAPVASLTVPDSKVPTLRAGVTLAQVREKLACEPETDEPSPSPSPSPEAPPVVATPQDPTFDPQAYYTNCAAARAAGVAPISRGSIGYRPGLDADDDGTACETNEDRAVGGGTDTGSGVAPLVTPLGSVDTGSW